MIWVMRHLDPARSIISKLGGVEVVSSITGKHVSRVYRWMYPRERGGTGGLIPTPDARIILEYAGENDVPLEAAEFFAFPEAEATSGAA